MNPDFKNRLFNWGMVLLAFWMLSGCHSGRVNQPLSIEKLRNTSHAKLINAYENYLQSRYNSKLSFTERETNSIPTLHSYFKRDLVQIPDLLYFPSTLWQIYTASGETKWEQAAKNFSDIIIETDVKNFTKEPATYQTVLYKSYLHSKDPEYLKVLLKTLSEIISPTENEFSKDSLPRLPKKELVEKMRSNEVLFFASKETGDPVYRNFALQNSEIIYASFSQADSFETCENKELQVLKLRKLAIGLYGFSYLFKETGIEKYQRLTHQLADNFIRVYNHAENNTGKELDGCINNEMDLGTQALVAVALFDLGDFSENKYRETSAQFFQHILATLSLSVNSDELQPSFQLFYYLFEYERRLHASGKRGALASDT
jgi:hypothetical protein